MLRVVVWILLMYASTSAANFTSQHTVMVKIPVFHLQMDYDEFEDSTLPWPM